MREATPVATPPAGSVFSAATANSQQIRRLALQMDRNHDDSSKPFWSDENCFGQDMNFDASQCLWTEVTQNEEDLSYMFDETTPVKACGDLGYQVMGIGETSKEAEHGKESCSQVKRRRMLQFDAHAVDPSLRCEELSSGFLKSDGSEREDSAEEVFSEQSQWISRQSASGCDSIDPLTDGWLAEYFNDPEMHFPNEGNCSGASDVQIDISEFWSDPPETAINGVQQRVARTPQKVVFKGRRSYIRTPTKLASSVAYPFAFVKPCGVHGDVTLKDINQRIRTPPPSKTKSNDEDPAAYPTSAFSGKPVVGKTKIRTEGGKGSITIMRTKG
ncbi:hypothetical protein EUGRSUZ_H00791 [Eucalyptus grandis]|uniref:Uncharacterized protein n=2 Tax=Eucalyptus grandis TaxID=71139 RepID=A0ACC3JML1_EUCGR|nr:hypothetical protein EUGRSUZ_H00791 [Eucalyptus grandis]